ncbi:MAG: DUF4249 domain-containing protein [Bernardetiaceae bacterium]|nr:DUF4249 domain-containing protein [Bernardetiaceae bacterium]
MKNSLKTLFDRLRALPPVFYLGRLAPLALLLPLWACEDVVELDLAEGRPQLVVDGFIDNRALPQTIRLTLTWQWARRCA